MPASIINCDDPRAADVVLLGANFDGTSSFGKGADGGPAAIVGCLDTQIEFYERFTGTTPVESLKIAYHDLGDLNALSPEAMVARVRAGYDQFAGGGKLVIMLGGEHSITNGPFQAMAASREARDVTVLHVDAHFDLRDTDADYADEPHGQYAHSCVLRRGVELGFPTVHVGIRAYAQAEYDFAREHHCTVFEWGRGVLPTVSQVVRAIKTQDVYVTLDADGIDPSQMPATGTPVQGGLDWYYTLDLLRAVCARKTLIGADLVEVAPRSTDHLTEYGAAQLVYCLIAFWHEKR